MAVLILPKSVVKEINDKYVTVEISEESIKIKGTKKWDSIEKARGILKNYDIDPIEYQKKCREEWENRI